MLGVLQLLDDDWLASLYSNSNLYDWLGKMFV